MGKPQKLISIQAVHKVWHLIVGGIEKLDYNADAQLQKVFTDLVVKWIPQFRQVNWNTFWHILIKWTQLNLFSHPNLDFKSKDCIEAIYHVRPP